MEFGICLASRPQDLDHVVRAEELGFTHCWMADSQMIWSDVYAMLALAAERTTTMQIGTGVAVAGTRPSSVTAAARPGPTVESSHTQNVSMVLFLFLDGGIMSLWAKVPGENNNNGHVAF